MVVLRSISLVITPPSVSKPSESGVTSSSTTFFDFAGQHARLNRRADGDHFIRVHRLVRFLAPGEAADQRLHRRNPR